MCIIVMVVVTGGEGVGGDKVRSVGGEIWGERSGGKL